MAIYTVHVPAAAPDPVAQADNTVFVRDGFSGRAFLFGLLYLLWHRLWGATLAWLLVLAGLWGFAVVIHPSAAVAVLLVGLMHLYLGTEGPDLRRAGLARQGQPVSDLVSAPDLDTAEALFFARRPPPVGGLAPRPPAPSWRPPAVPAVIGMFPEGSGS